MTLLTETKQILEHMDTLEEELLDHIATTKERRDIVKALRDSYDRRNRPPTLSDMGDMAESLRKEIMEEEEGWNPGKESNHGAGDGVRFSGADSSSSAASGSQAGTDLSSAGLSD